MFRLVNKTTNEVERISDDRIFYDEKKYDLVEYDPVDKRKKAIQFINNATTMDDIKIILKKIVNEII